MEIGNKVWINKQDIDSCGYGNSVNCEGIIIEVLDNNYYIVEYKTENCFYPVKTDKFHEFELKMLIDF